MIAKKEPLDCSAALELMIAYPALVAGVSWTG